MQIFKANLFALGLLILGPGISFAAPESFEYYWEEFLTNELEAKDPMALLISERLAESLFDAKDEEEFLRLSDQMRATLKQRPDKAAHAVYLNNCLHREFTKRLQKQNQRKKIYSAAGAVVGTLVAIPAGHFLSKKFGNRLFWLVVPAGAVAGFGAGWFFGHMKHGLPSPGVEDVWTGDVEDIYREIGQTD